MGKNKLGKDASAEVILHRDLSTNTQVGILLSVCNTMTNVLLNPEREAENIPGKHLLPGEAKIAAENTFTKACERLEKIITEEKRWGLDYQMTLEQQFLDRHQEQLSLIKAQQDLAAQQRKSAETITRPHFRYKPFLIPMDDGKWVAFLGNPEDLDAGILGAGDNPQAALESFDDAFAGKLPPAIAEWLKNREEDLERGISKLEPFPKEELNDKKGMEQDGDRNPDQPAKKQDDDLGNSARPGT